MEEAGAWNLLPPAVAAESSSDPFWKEEAVDYLESPCSEAPLRAR